MKGGLQVDNILSRENIDFKLCLCLYTFLYSEYQGEDQSTKTHPIDNEN